jgi:hypothetical protein
MRWLLFVPLTAFVFGTLDQAGAISNHHTYACMGLQCTVSLLFMAGPF